MNKLVDKRVRMNLYPFKGSAFLLEAFEEEARSQGWSDTEVALAINQTKGLPLDDRYEILINYCSTYKDHADCTQEDVQYMLCFLGQRTHYLYSKLIESWDEYDYSNYNSLKRKATKRIKGVYAHFDEHVEEKDKYQKQYKPNLYFDTHEEALEAVPVGQELLINIYALWIQE